jgi:cyclopropane-fatty-acyl-phospholipid synthase
MDVLKRHFDPELAKAGITLNGTAPYDPQVHDDRLYMRVLLHGTLGLGEAYMEKWWDCDDLTVFFTRLIKMGENEKRLNISAQLLNLSQTLLNRQTIFRARKVGEQHYDLGNDLYAAMLDKRMVYTCGYWKDVEDKSAKGLDAAQEHKLRLICEKLSLKPGQRVLDIGCAVGVRLQNTPLKSMAFPWWE